MKRNRMLVGFLMVVMLVTPVMAQPSYLWSQQCDGEVRVRGTTVECWPIEQPPEPTATPTVEPGITPTVEPTVTVTPTVPPEPTPTATPGGVPMCAHDPLLWHDLFDEAQGCRFDHEHGDNPNLGNSVFGSPGAWYGAPNTEIGGPFAMTSEMGGGHVFWKWYTHMNIPPGFTELRPPGGSYIRDLRVLTHVTTGGPVDPPAAGSLRKRFHGGSVEANVCQPATDRSVEHCGIFRMAGVFDFGNLRIDDTDTGIIYLPEEGQMANLGLAGRRTHPTWDGILAMSHPGVTWYGRTWCAQSADTILACVDLAAIVNDPWTYVIPGNANVTVGFIGDPDNGYDGFNASNREIHIVGPHLWETSPLSLTWAGNQDGGPNPGCVLGQMGCGYVVVEGLPEVGHEQYASHGQSIREYDTSPPGQYWIGFPN